MNRIVSLILSFITAFAGLFYVPVDEIPSYVENITQENICLYTENAGFLKNTMVMIFEEDATLSDKISAFAKANGFCVGKIRDLDLYIIRTPLSDKESADKLSRNLTSLDGVLLAGVYPVKRYEEQYTPDDPFIGKEGFGTYDWDDENPDGNNWHIEATYTRSAWGYKSLFNDIPIGVVDGGFDIAHEDLQGKITFPTKREERRNRPNNHGTHVAGIIAATQDNGIGPCGICPQSTLICVDWSPSTNQLWIADLEILVGFKKAVQAGAKVVNFSVGASGSVGENKTSNPEFIRSLDAVFYSYTMGKLLSKGYDFVVVQSAGNGNDGGRAIDASQNGVFCAIDEKNVFLPFPGIKAADLLDRIIIVGSAENTEKGYYQSSSSNVGDIVDICAPGVEVYSTTRDNTYLTKSGTSMASPVVTGIAGLVWSVNPDLTGKDVKRIVCESTSETVLPSEERYFDSLGYQAYPMVNAKLSVENALKETGEFFDVTVSANAKEEITITDEAGNEFVFEANPQGVLTCVLKNGSYIIETETVTKEITVNGETEIVL